MHRQRAKPRIVRSFRRADIVIYLQVKQMLRAQCPPGLSSGCGVTGLPISPTCHVVSDIVRTRGGPLLAARLSKYLILLVGDLDPLIKRLMLSQ